MSKLLRSELSTKDTVKSEGLNVWVDGSADGQPAKVDIILVQGLGSHPYYTWTGSDNVSKDKASRFSLAGLRISSKSKTQSQEVNAVIPEVFWPRDLIPQHLPPSRIATYSYKSDWRSRDFKTTLWECGNQLLNILYQHRQEKSILTRPIIFIGHSLGGLVIQQALVIADHGATFKDIRKSTSGAIFLGVPQQGSDYAGSADLLTRACGNDQPLLRNLKAHSPDLLSLARDFWSEYGRLPAVCFYEKNDAKLGPIKIKMVSSQSASVVEKRMIYLNTDHSGLNKFRHENDENFQLVLPELITIAKDAVNRHYEVLAKERPTPTTIIPFPKDNKFVEREAYMSRINSALGGVQSSTRVALVGMGGVGKSQIAIEYAYRVREHDQEISIFWVHASSQARFLSSYKSIATELKLLRADDPNANILDIVHAWLASESSGRWLILLDNADDARFVHADYDNEDPPQYDWTITKYLPHRVGGTVVVTTRSRDAAFGLVGQEDLIVKIEPMSDDEAKQLLHTKISNRHSNEDDENDLITELDNIPLAITQAAAYLSRKQRMTIRNYLDRLRDDEETSLLNTGGGDLRRDPEATNSVMRTWQISFDQIKIEDELAADLLSRMCMFDKQGIPEILLKEGLNDCEYRDAIEVLLGYSFIDAGTNESGFQIHRLVQLATRTWLRVHSEFESRSEAALKLLTEKYPPADYENWTTCQTLEPHAEAILNFPYISAEARLFCAELWLNRAWYLNRQGGYVEAEVMAKRSLCIRDELLGEEDPLTAETISILVNLYVNLGFHSKAEALGLDALKVSKRLHRDEHVNTLDLMHLLARTYRDQGRLEEAEMLFLRVLSVKRRVYGEKSLTILYDMDELAHVYNLQERWREAKELHVQVLERRKELLGEEHPDTVITIGNLAITLQRPGQGRWEEAKELEVQVLEIRKRVLGKEHPDTLKAMANLAVTLSNSDPRRWDEAEKLEVQVLETRKKVLGEEHLDTLTAMANLAVTLSNSDPRRWDEAEKLEVQVLETRKKVLGEEHLDTLEAMDALAQTYYGQGHLSKAIEMLTQAHQHAEHVRETKGVKHPALAQWTEVLENWKLEDVGKRARNCWDQGLWDESERLGTVVLQMSKRIRGVTHLDTIISTANLAYAYWVQGRISAAIELMTKALHDADITPDDEDIDMTEWSDTRDRWRKRLEKWKMKVEDPEHCSEQHSTSDDSSLQESEGEDWVTEEEAGDDSEEQEDDEAASGLETDIDDVEKDDENDKYGADIEDDVVS